MLFSPPTDIGPLAGAAWFTASIFLFFVLATIYGIPHYGLGPERPKQVNAMVAALRIDCVTGAFGFTGRFIARRLLERGIAIRTLTNHPDAKSPLAPRVEVRPYAFDRPEQLAKDLEGVHTLYNTYWVRFERGATRFDTAVRNTRRLFEAARAAGVRRVVHVSIANADAASDLPYCGARRQRGRRSPSLVPGEGTRVGVACPHHLTGRSDAALQRASSRWTGKYRTSG